MMGKRILALLTALTLALGTAPAALAAVRPNLVCEFLRDNESMSLSLEDLDGGDVYGVQLELTLEGEYPGCAFTPDSRTAYAPDCGVLVSRGRTRVTVYLTDKTPLNEGDYLPLGILELEGDGTDALGTTAHITLLDERLRPMSGTASVEPLLREDSGSRPGSALPEVSLPFIDVRPGDWFYGAVGYVYTHGMMRGMTELTFAPYETMNRAMIVTILHRLEGSPAALPAAFTDVREGQYYAAPVAWASAADIVEGYTDNTFRPEDPITREQLTAILYRYARYKGLDVSVRGDLGRFPDAVSVSLYAADALSWAVGAELIGSTDSVLQPRDAAQRAQAALMFQRLCEGLLEMP